MVEFILAVFFLELTPGPNMAYLVTLALARGRAAGLYATLGVTLGLSVHAVVTVFGAGTLIQHYPWLYEILRWTGAAYLLFLAWEGWRPEKEVSPGGLICFPPQGRCSCAVSCGTCSTPNPFSSSFPLFPPSSAARRAIRPSPCR